MECILVCDGSELLLAAVGEEGEHERLVVVDANTWRPSGKVNLPSEAQVLEWSPDRSQLAAGLGTERAVTFLDDDLRRIRTSEVGDHPFDLAYSPDGSMLAAAGAEGKVATVLDTATGRQVNAPAKLTSDFISDVEWLPDNNTVVASGADSVAVLYDVDADIVRAGSMPAADSLEAGYAFLLPEPDDEVVVLDGQHPGLRYPLRRGPVAGPRVRGRRPRPHPSRVGAVRPGGAVPAHVQRPRRGRLVTPPGTLGALITQVALAGDLPLVAFDGEVLPPVGCVHPVQVLLPGATLPGVADVGSGRLGHVRGCLDLVVALVGRRLSARSHGEQPRDQERSGCLLAGRDVHDSLLGPSGVSRRHRPRHTDGVEGWSRKGCGPVVAHRRRDESQT